MAKLGTNEEAGRLVISKTLKLIDASAHAADQEALTVRSRLTTVKAEIGRLVAVLKEMGTGTLDSIKEELARLESEKRELQAPGRTPRTEDARRSGDGPGKEIHRELAGGGGTSPTGRRG